MFGYCLGSKEMERVGREWTCLSAFPVMKEHKFILKLFQKQIYFYVSVSSRQQNTFPSCVIYVTYRSSYITKRKQRSMKNRATHRKCKNTQKYKSEKPSKLHIGHFNSIEV
jgi:hypothetical protein